MLIKGSAAIFVGAALFVLCACSVDDAGEPIDASASPLPTGISVDIHQNRTDVAARALQVAVTNSTDGVVAIESVAFRSQQFEGSAVWQKDRTTIAQGVTADLPVSLGAPRCDDSDARPQVELTYRVAEGTEQTVTVDVVDRMGQLAAMKKADCLLADVSTVVMIEASGPLITAPTGMGSQAIAHVELSLVPTGARGTVAIVGVRSTTLLAVSAVSAEDAEDAERVNAGGAASPRDAGAGDAGEVDAGAAAQSVFPVSVSGTEPPRVLTLEVRPARCDEHALAEDKRGTILPVRVEAGDASGEISVAASPALRAELYNFVRAACASP
jgi:hypothetical protein